MWLSPISRIFFFFLLRKLVDFFRFTGPHFLVCWFGRLLCDSISFCRLCNALYWFEIRITGIFGCSCLTLVDLIGVPVSVSLLTGEWLFIWEVLLTVRIKNLMSEQPIFPDANAHFKTPLELHFIYLCNKEIYCILRHATSSLFHFPQNATHFIILPSVQIIHFS